MSLMDIAEISRLLACRIDSLVPDLLPAAVKEGYEWRIGSCAGEIGRSMAIHSGGAQAGIWCDFSGDNLRGDALDLIAQVKFAGNKKDAVAYAKSWLGLDNLSPDRLKTVRQQARTEEKKAKRKAEQAMERKRKYAHALWLNAEARLANTPVDRYLRGRCIVLSDLPREIGSIRYKASLEYPAGMNGGVKTSWPAMVSAVVNGDGAHIATHRTYLHIHDDGRVTKAPVPDAKLTIGSYRGGFIPLGRGKSNKSLRHAPEGDTAIICEGIEDGLSILTACPDYRVLAAISVTNFQCIELPPAVTNIIIAADNDPADSPAGKALQAAIDRFIDQGRFVRVARSPVGKDFNDALIEEKTAQEREGRVV